MCAPSVEGTRWVPLPQSMWCERPHWSPEVSVCWSGRALGLTVMLVYPPSVTSFPSCVTGTLLRGFSRLQRTRKVQTRMHVACFGGPRLADSQIQSRNKPTHHFGPCFKKKKNFENKNLHFFLWGTLCILVLVFFPF